MISRAVVVGWMLCSLQPQDSKSSAESIKVVQTVSGSYHNNVIVETDWVEKNDIFTENKRSIPRGNVLTSVQALLTARRDVPDLLFELGVTREGFEAHRGDILKTALPPASEALNLGQTELSGKLESMLQWERVAPLILKYAHQGPRSTTTYSFRAEFRVGGHMIIVESDSVMPWRLPWRLTIDGAPPFSCDDLVVPRALRGFADPDAVCYKLLDGASCWGDRFWSSGFWYGYLRSELNSQQVENEYQTMAGWSDIAAQFDVESVTTGNVDVHPESILFLLTAKTQRNVARVRWYNRLREGRPAFNWSSLVTLHRAAEAVVSSQQWLLDWKSSSMRRALEINCAGEVGIAEIDLDELVQPAWDDAGFSGSPQFEICMLEGKEACGTVYVAVGEAGALILAAHTSRLLDRSLEAIHETGDSSGSTDDSATKPHWFDDIVLSFHPCGEPPTYGRVDGTGSCEVRVMTSRAERPRQR